MKLLVVGFPKSGTKSVASALIKLGYDVYDFDTTFEHLGKDWMKIFTKGGTKEDFYRMYKDVEASVDVPASVFWEDILEAFPDVKLIFMQRNSEEEWVRSMQKQIKMLNANYTMKMWAWFSPTARAFYLYTNHMTRTVFSGPMTGKFFAIPENISPTVMKMRYRNHNASVLLRAPKDQLLVFKVTDGWEPLCKFLGKPVPETPFPHKNKGASLFDEYVQLSPVFQKMRSEMKIFLSIYIAVFAISVYYVCNFVLN